MVYSINVENEKDESLSRSQKSVKLRMSSRNSAAEEYKMNEIVPIDASTEGKFSKTKSAFETA